MLPNPKIYIPAVALIIASLAASLARGEESWTDTQIVEAIFQAEGGAKAQFLYGIRSVRYDSPAEALKICFNTVRNNRKRYADYGHKQFSSYLEFLASRYCPTKGKLSKAERRLNRHWIRNVRYFLALNNGGKLEQEGGLLMRHKAEPVVSKEILVSVMEKLLRHYSKEEIATKTGKGYYTVHHWVKGNRYPNKGDWLLIQKIVNELPTTA